MAKAQVYNQFGENKGEINLNTKVFDIEPKISLIKQAVLAILSNRRLVLAHTRGEVRGGGRKPWAQKGTGRARQGSIRAPQWKGGAVIFGPTKDRNFEVKINKKMKTKALFMVLSDKATDESISIFESLAVKEMKTKTFAELFKKIGFKKGLLVIEKMDKILVKAIDNIPDIKVISANSLNVYDVLNAKKIFFTKESLAVVDKTFLKVE